MIAESSCRVPFHRHEGRTPLGTSKFKYAGQAMPRIFMHEINAKLGVDMPITETTYRILYERMAPMMEMRLLSDKLA